MQRHGGGTPDIAQERENLLQTSPRHIGLDVYLPAFFQMSESRVDFTDGTGNRPLGVHDALNGRGGVLFRFRLLLLQFLFSNQFVGLVAERTAVDFLAGIDGQLDALRQLFDFGQQVLDPFQPFFRLAGPDFQIEVEIFLLAVLPPEGLLHGLHHLVDVGHDRRKAHPTLAQFLDGIGKGGDLLGSFRGIDLYIVIDFVVLRLSHEINVFTSVERIVLFGCRGLKTKAPQT